MVPQRRVESICRLDAIIRPSGNGYGCVSSPRMVELSGAPCRAMENSEMTISLAKKGQGVEVEAEMLPSRQARLNCRAGMASSTAGVANGFVQGNLAILPEKLAAAFHRFCQLNPKPCPVIGMSDVGNPRIPALGIDLDIRTDLPRYRVWRAGEGVEDA